jgi:hypothetical protein
LEVLELEEQVLLERLAVVQLLFSTLFQRLVVAAVVTSR